MIDEKLIREFKHRFFVICSVPNGKLKIDGIPIHFNMFSNICIYDRVCKKIILKGRGDIKTTFSIDEWIEREDVDKELKIFNDYKVDDPLYKLGQDKTKPQIKKICDIYAVGGIWMAYTYLSKGDRKRMCINTNIFGTQKYLNSREFNLEILINDL